jgi:CDP-glucose 4,6-dehydratase
MSAPFTTAFADRRVLVTGHTGFKGSWLALWLHRLGANVTGYALTPTTAPNNFTAAGVADVLDRHEEGDIRDGSQLATLVREVRPDVIFHLAAQPLVRASYQQPRETFEVNVIGTASLLDAVRAAERPCAVVVVTSDKCYENTGAVWGYRENDPMGGHDPYSASKGAAEIVTAAYRRSFFAPEALVEHGVSVATVRAGNVIGGGDWCQDRIVPDVVRHVVAGTPIPLRNPCAVRPWQHVLEPLGGYLMLAARMLDEPSPRWCAGWNFGPASGDALNVGALVDLLLEEWGEGSWDDVSRPDQVHEAQTLRLNIDKALCELGWQPRWNVREVVRRTAQWYRTYYERGPRADMLDICLSDIEAYERAWQRAAAPSRTSRAKIHAAVAGR